MKIGLLMVEINISGSAVQRPVWDENYKVVVKNDNHQQIISFTFTFYFLSQN